MATVTICNRLLLRWSGVTPAVTEPGRRAAPLLLWLCPLLFGALRCAVFGYEEARAQSVTRLAGVSAICLHTIAAGFIGMCVGCWLTSRTTATAR